MREIHGSYSRNGIRRVIDSAAAAGPGTTPSAVTVVKGACPHDCPDTCALDVHVRDGIAIKVTGSAAHAPTAGVLCTKVARYTERTYHPDRLLHPLRRVGKHEELANLAAFLVSDGAAYINGDAIVIDGGKMLQSAGGGASTQSMIDWTDEQWEAIRPKKK